MAISFFKQRDIDAMDPHDIPEEFVNYFDSLPEKRKIEIIKSRPDLADGLGYYVSVNSRAGSSTEEAASSKKEENNNNKIGARTVAEIQNTDESDYDMSGIAANMFQNLEMDAALVDGLNPVEILTLPEHSLKCPVHRSKFEEKYIRYRNAKGAVFSMRVLLCRQCKRIFQEESRVKPVSKHLDARNIKYTIYDKELTARYLKSQMPVYILDKDEKVYVPETWIEEEILCPIHGDDLYERICEKRYKNRKITFKGYFCDRCQKVIVRNAYIADLADLCAENGIPEIESKVLLKKVPKKKIVPRKEVKPDYFIQDGKKVAYTYKFTAECHRLSEEDTVVVSDSIYCYLEGHNTEEILAMIMVNEKRRGRKAYLFKLGYCSQCQKYYMDDVDYRAVYSLGRPEVTVLSNLDSDSYQITSGEVFNIERRHLGNLERDIDNEINDIKSSSDYVNPYAVGDDDDGALAYSKSVSKHKYGALLDRLTGYQPKPYSYRVDISCDGDTEIYYVGPEDIDIDGRRQVISFNSDFGHELVNYQTIKVKRGSKEYNIKLSRQFDIDNATLYGYANLRTDEDIIFRSGVTDPFLVRVLNMRKKQHNLIDIIATIQENQNRIVDTSFKQNIIVQGCAGSGKTMVLLHRLSALKYKQRNFDFSRYALILTPNEKFSLHIKGLAEGLQIGTIERQSVEQYYISMLRQYSEDFKPANKLNSEMAVNQDFVDYIYSDYFLKDFKMAYHEIMKQRTRLLDIVNLLTDVMGQPHRNIDRLNQLELMKNIKYAVEDMDVLVRNQDKVVEEAKSKLDKIESRKIFLQKNLPKYEKFASDVVNEALGRVYAKISSYISERQHIITQINERLVSLENEKKNLTNSFFVIGKKTKLEKIESEIEKVTIRKNSEDEKQKDENSVFNVTLKGKSDEEILAWMRQLMFYIPDVKEEVRLCVNAYENRDSCQEELNGISTLIEEADLAYKAELSKVYGDDERRIIRYLKKKIIEYDLLGTYQKIFDRTVFAFRNEHKISDIKGRCHRYDFYAQLIFAKKYFGEVHGDTKFMCVDEGQDLAINEYKLLRELNPNTLVLNVYGDTNQLMKSGRGISDWRELKALIGAKEYKLHENYRNTNQITRFCNRSFGMNVLQTGVDGAKVREIARKDLETELSKLRLNTERVAILLPRRVLKSKYIDKDMLPDDICKRMDDTMENGHIAMMYVDEVKGIEFDKVFVVGNTMSRNEKYIAYTRALSELIVVVDDTIQGKKETETQLIM